MNQLHAKSGIPKMNFKIFAKRVFCKKCMLPKTKVYTVLEKMFSSSPNS